MEDNTTQVAESTQRDADVATSKPNFELLSNEDFTSQNINNTTTEEPKAETEVKEEVKVDEQKQDAPLETELALDETKEEVKQEVKEEVKDEPKEEEFELKLDDDAAQSADAEEGSWLAVAKLDGLELQEDSYEAFKEALTKPLLEEVEKAKSLSLDNVLSELAPEARMYVELSKMGLSHKDIVKPFEAINTYRNMQPAELYRADLTAKIEQIRELTEADKEWIDADVERKIESGQIEHEATRIKLELDAIEKSINDERQAKINEYRLNSEKALQDKRRNEVESISKSLDNMSEFMGSSLSADVKKGLADRYASGKYDQILSDPAMKAKFIAFVELGDKALKNLEAKSYMKGKLEYAQMLHNVPPLDKGGSGVQTRNMDGNFERLANDPTLMGG